MKFVYKKAKNLEALTDWLNTMGDVEIVYDYPPTGEVIVKVLEPYESE